MKQAAYFIIFGILSLGGAAFGAEVKFGTNQLTCTNDDLGTFELQYTVAEKVLSTESYSDEKTPAAPSWEILDSHLDKIEFTSGKLVSPAGVKGTLGGVELKVLRNVWKGPAAGTIDMNLSFAQGSFLIQSLFIDHNHPDKYQTPELGAQTFAWLPNGIMAQLFFKCQ